MNEPDIRGADPWAPLRAYTVARIAIGRAGTGMTTKEVLSFRADHASARDAVHSKPDFDALAAALEERDRRTLRLRTRARDRAEYLRRPDLGRLLDAASAAAVGEAAAAAPPGGYDVALAIGDGLSAFGVDRYAAPVAEALIDLLERSGRTVAPVALIEQARVGAADPVGAGLEARAVVILIGERPGLSVSDSLGAYLTYAPLPRMTDEARNCVSNIHRAGLSPADAAAKLFYLIGKAFRLGLSGVALKDDQEAEERIPVLPCGTVQRP